MSPLFYRRAQLREILGLKTVYFITKFEREGLLTPVRFGSRDVYYDAREIEALRDHLLAVQDAEASDA
jgi:hypothetical protein